MKPPAAPAFLKSEKIAAGVPGPEEALRQSEESYRGLFDTIRLALSIQDPDGRFIEVNFGACAMYGYARADFIGRTTEFLAAPGLNDFSLIAEKNRLAFAGEPQQIEFWGRRKNGEIFPSDVRIYRGTFFGNDVLIAAATDITEQKRADKARRESEERYHHLLTAVTDYVFTVRVQKGHAVETTHGPGCEAVTGYTTRDFSRDPGLWLRMVVEEDRPSVVLQAEQILAGDPVHSLEHRIVHKNGQVRWVINTLVPRYDLSGKLTAYDGLVQDITDRKVVELAFAKSEAQLSAIILASPIPMFVIDNRHRVIAWNRALENTSGIKSSEVLGTDRHWSGFYPAKRSCLADLLVDRAPDRIPELYSDKFKISDTIHGAFEATDFFPDMGTGGKWLHFMAAPITDHEGNVIGSVETLEDITTLIRAQQDLEESEERYRTLIDQLPDYVIVHRDGILLYVNRTAAASTGYNADTLVGQHISRFIAPEHLEKVREAVGRRMAGEDLPAYEMRIVAREGTLHTVLVHGASIHFEGRPASLNVLTDITLIKQAEEKIRLANEELEKRVTERTEALIRTNDQLHSEIAARGRAEEEITRSLEEKDLLLREIHHRVKNNLQIIASLLKLQSRYIHDPLVLDSIKESQSRVRAMALVHERIYRSHNIAEINLRDYLNYLTRQIFQFYNIQQHVISLSVTMEDIMADIDTVTPLGLIMNELVSNSLKHAFPDGRKGRVSIECTAHGTEMLRFIYHDDGTGIPDGFDWKNAESLGLRLVNNLVDQLNGTIELVKGNGTTFIIEIRKTAS